MHFDDRLATVLAVSATGENQYRVQFRQLLDLVGTMPAGTRSAALDRAMLKLAELSGRIAPAERAAAVSGSGGRLRNPRLVAELAGDHPAVAAATISAARLSDEQWLDILPTLPPAARAMLLRRSDLGPALTQRLAMLGDANPGLPQPAAMSLSADTPALEPAGSGSPELPISALEADQTSANILPLRTRGTTPNDAATPDDAPAEVAQTGLPGPEGIGAIVRRIEAFRRSRQVAQPAANDAPLLPLVDEAAAPRLQALAFACDGAGRINWADASLAGMVVGLRLPLVEQPGGGLGSAFRRRLPVRAAMITLEGAPAIEGEWLLDAASEFDREGRFTGYIGKLRRPSQAVQAAPENPEALRVRQVLHELRTPVNAIQGFAELIHQQLVGPVPHTYRALAAGIASDAAQMLAGFDELDRLARLDSAALALEPGTADLAMIVSALIRQLEPFTGPRQSGFTLASPTPHCLVTMSADEAERIGWRLFATLAGAARPGERLAVNLGRDHSMVTLAIALPEALAALPDPCEGNAPPLAQAVSGGLFGTGFALRLAAAEASAAGGSLAFCDGQVQVTLPAAAARQLTEAAELPTPDSVSASNAG